MRSREPRVLTTPPPGTPNPCGARKVANGRNRPADAVAGGPRVAVAARLSKFMWSPERVWSPKAAAAPRADDAHGVVEPPMVVAASRAAARGCRYLCGQYCHRRKDGATYEVPRARGVAAHTAVDVHVIAGTRRGAAALDGSTPELCLTNTP